MDRGHTVAALLALAACIACSTAAPMASNQTALELQEGPKDGCYYNFQHYGENDRIMTNEPCLNCTCHNRMLMCYLRVCPFTKAIGQDCTIEKRADQCCPIVTCPDVPVDLLTSTSTFSPAEYGATGLGKLDKYGCSINGKYFSEGAKVPPSPNKPCENCYCIRNMTTCVMQECTLHVDGCIPIYQKDVCCPVRYSCDHPDDGPLLLDDMTTTVRPTPGFLLTTTTVLPVTQATQDCVHADQVFPDGALIKTEKACEHCYCMKGDIVCVVQECGTPMENEGKNCTSLPPRHGQCCPDTYICEGDEPGSELLTDIPEVTTTPPRRGGIEGSGYRNEPDESYTEGTPSDNNIEGSGEENLEAHTDIVETIPEKVTPEVFDFTLTTTGPSKISESTESDKGQNTITNVQEEIVTYATETNIDSKVTSDDMKTTYNDNSKTVISDYHASTPISDLSLNNILITTESTEKSDENVVIHNEKATTQHVIDETTAKQEYLGENDLATKPTELNEYDKNTTPGLGSGTTKQKDFDSDYYVTTESLERVEDNYVVDSKKTTVHDFVDEMTPEQEHSGDKDLTITESVQNAVDNVNLDKKTTTNYNYEETTRHEQLDGNDLITTESTNIIDENLVFGNEKTTIKDFIDQTTNQEHNDQVTTKYVETTDYKDHFNTKTTTTQGLSSESTKNDQLIENVSMTTESVDLTDDHVIVDAKKTTMNDFVDETTKQKHLGETDSVTTESIEKTDEHITDNVKSTTVKDYVDETTKQEHLGGNEPVTTESIDKHNENILDSFEKTTTKDFVGEITKQDLYDDNDSSTTETIEKVDKHIIIDSKKTTVQDFIDETTQKQESLVTKPDDVLDVEPKISTQAPEHISDIDQTKSTEVFTTQISLDKPESSAITTQEKETYTTKTLEITDLYTTTKNNIYDDRTTPVNLIENEIIENITPTILPSRIPGEGDCLLNSLTYKNNTIVPSTNNCHTSCKCISSIIKCDPIICSPPPAYMKDCKPFYESPDSCCPTYLCQTEEAMPPQPHNQMSDADNKKDTVATECDTSDCINENTPSKTTSDCSGNECANSDQLCDKESGCLEITVPTSCNGEKCDDNLEISYTTETQTSAQKIPMTDCENESACKKPIESNIESECSDEKCKRKQHGGVESKPSSECLDSDCTQYEKVLPSELPSTEFSTAKTVETESDKKTDQDLKSTKVPTNEATITDYVTPEPTAVTTVRESVTDVVTEKIVLNEPSVSNDKVTKASESVTEISKEKITQTDGSQINTEPTEYYGPEYGKTETVQKIETGTEKVVTPTDTESQVTKEYGQGDNELHKLEETEHDKPDVYEISTTTNEQEHTNPEKDIIDINSSETPEKESTNPQITPLSEVPYITTIRSEADQTVTEKVSHDTSETVFNIDVTTFKINEAEIQTTSTSSSDIHESESDKDLTTQVSEVKPLAENYTPTLVSYESTERNEKVTEYPEKATKDSTMVSESDYEKHSTHTESLTTIAPEIDDHSTTQQNLIEFDHTTVTHMLSEDTSVSPTTDETKTSEKDPDNDFTKSITDIEVSPEVVTKKQVEDFDDNKENQNSVSYDLVTSNIEKTTKKYMSTSTDLPLYSESEPEVTVTSEEIHIVQSHTEPNEMVKEQEEVTDISKIDLFSESPEVNTEKSVIEEVISPVKETDGNGVDISDIELKETVTTSTSEKSETEEQEPNREEMSNTSIIDQDNITENPEPYSTILDQNKNDTEQVETHTVTPYQDFTDMKFVKDEDMSLDNKDKLTTHNTLLTIEAQPVTISYHTDTNDQFDTSTSNFVQNSTYNDLASTEKIFTKELPFTNAPQYVEKETETSVIEKTTTVKTTLGNTKTEEMTIELSTLNNQELMTEVPFVTKLSESTKTDVTPPDVVIDSATETHDVTTEISRISTQLLEHQNSPSQQDITTTSDELYSLDKGVTTINPEAVTAQENGDISTDLDENEQSIKPTEISIKPDVTTQETIFDSNLSNTDPNVLEADKTESSITVDIKDSEDKQFTEKPQSHVTEAINLKQDYDTEPTITTSNVDNANKNQSPGVEDVTENEPNVNNIITVKPDLYPTVVVEMVTKENPTALHEIETKSPELYTTFNDATTSATNEKEYTKLPQSDDSKPDIVTNMSPLTESIDTKFTASSITESTKPYDSELQPLAESSTDQTPVNTIEEENIKSTEQEHYSTIGESSVTEIIEHHAEEQKPVREKESNTDKTTLDDTLLNYTTEKMITEDGTQKLFSEITTKLPAELITDNNLLQVDVSTEFLIQPGKVEEAVTSQEEMITEIPYLQKVEITTMDSKSVEEEGMKETIFQDQKEISTQTPETNKENELHPVRPEHETEQTTQKQIATTKIDFEVVATESSVIKEPSNIPVSLVTEKNVNELLTVTQSETTSPNTLLSENNEMSTVQSTVEVVHADPVITDMPIIDSSETSVTTDISEKDQNYPTDHPYGITTAGKEENDLLDEKQNIDKTLTTLVTEIDQVAYTNPPDLIEDDHKTKETELSTNMFKDVTTLPPISEKTETEDSAIQSHSKEPDSQTVQDGSLLEVTQTTGKYMLSETSEPTKESTKTENKYSETTPYLIELEEHTHQIKDDITSGTSIEEESTTVRYLSHSTERGDLALPDNFNEYNIDNQVDQKFPENNDVSTPAGEDFFNDKTSLKEDIPTILPSYTVKDEESSTKYTTAMEEESALFVSSSSVKPIEEEMHTIASFDTDKSSSAAPETEVLPEKEVQKEVERTEKPTSDEEYLASSSPSPTNKPIEELTTQFVEHDKISKPDDKLSETYFTPETPKPDFSEPPTDDIHSPDFPPSGNGGYGQEPDYGEEDQSFGPGTCRYGGKVYVSAQQIPRDDPCDFCFCFRSDIICLQQSCPPPIHGCHEEPIQGFCCPRYECPVSMATAVNVTTTTTTTTTTLPPHFLPHAYKGAAHRRGCQIKGHTYKVGEVVRASSGPCLHCTCGGDGQMKCDPKVCTPEPMLRQMIAAAVSAKRRR